MLTLISPLRVISVIAVSYAVFCMLVMLIATHIFQNMESWVAIRIALSSAVVLDLCLLLAVHFWWRKLWAKFPTLTNEFFPDLNGKWQMTIHWSGADKDGKPIGGIVNAVAYIKQNFLHMSMEVQSEDSDSETLMAKPKKDPESGRPLVYYIYRVVPKNKHAEPAPSYEGAAVLKFNGTQCAQLSGNYFTSKMRQGFFTLERP